MAYVPNSNSVVAFQSQPSSLLVGASIIGLTPVAVTNIPTVNINTASGSVAAWLQSNNASVITVGTFTASVPATSVVQQGTWQVSVMNTIPSSLLVGASIIGTVPVTGTVFVAGSIATVGSVTVLQGTNPWLVGNSSVQTIQGTTPWIVGSVLVTLQSSNASVITVGGGTTGNSSVTAFQGGTWITSLVSTIPSSVQVGASIMGTVPVTQTTSPWIINMPSPSMIAYQAAGSIMAVSATVNTGNSSVQLLNGIATIGSVTALQGTNPWQVNVPTPSYISYQLAGSIMAVAATVNTGNSSVQLLGGIAVIGSVATLQGTNPWQVNVPTPSYISYQLAGSVMAVSATVNTGNSSVQLLNGVAVIGSVATLQGTTPWIVNMPSPSVISYQAAGSIMAVSGSFSSGNTSVTAFQGGAWTVSVVGNMNSSVTAFQGGTWITSLVSTIPSSVQVGASIMGTVPVTQVGTWGASVTGTVFVAGSVLAVGSITALQGTNPWLIGNSSVQTIQGTTPWVVGSVIATIQSSVAAAITNITASIITNQGTNPWIIGSIVGTYAEDSGSGTTDKGLFVLGVRNDTVSSLTSSDLDYGGHAIDAMGRSIIKPFAGEDATIISYNGSVVSGSVTLIQASAIGKRSYITDFWLSNTGGTTTLAVMQGGDTSVVGQFIVPTGGGFSSPGIAIPLKTTLSQDLAFKATPSTSILYLTLKGYQAP